MAGAVRDAQCCWERLIIYIRAQTPARKSQCPGLDDRDVHGISS
jgi:hypothetical protein